MRTYCPTETRSRITKTPALKVNRLQNDLWKRDKEYWEKVVNSINESDNLLKQIYDSETRALESVRNGDLSGGFLWNEEAELIKGEGDE